MARVRPVRRRLVAIVAVVPLVLAAAVAAGGPSQAASFLQSAGVSVSVAGGQAFTSTPTTVTFKVTNNPTNTASLAAFTLVVPKGIGVVRPLGVTVPANWREVVVPCGSSRSCSSLVLVYGTGPPGTSVAPGQFVIASILFTTPSTPGPLAFSMIGIGGGLFTTSDHPTVNVVAGTAASFKVSAPASVTAGANATITVQALDASLPTPMPTAYAGGQVKIQLGIADNKGASITPTSFAGSTQTFSPSPSSVLVTLPASATGTYTFNATFYVAAQQGITVTETKPVPDATGTRALTVVPGPAATITFDSITDASPDLALPNPTVGKNFVSSFHVNDQYMNQTSTAPGDVTFTANGPGSLTAVTSTPATPTADGTFTDTYSAPSLSVQFTVTLTTTSTTSSLSSPVDASGTTASFVVNQPGFLGTSNYATHTDGSTNCTLGAALPICGIANLPHGANGQVSLAEQVCTDVTGLCAPSNVTRPLVLTVTGNFNDSFGHPLYSNVSPASETLTCLAAVCKPRPDDGGVIANSDEERLEDFSDFPLYIQLTHSEGFVVVPSCQVIPTGEDSTLVPATTIPTGDSACVDVASITRNTAGDVSFTVLFVDDPKTHP